MAVSQGNCSARSGGFTLIELMVVITIIAVLLVVAPPTFQKQVKDSRLSASTNNLVRGLMTARSESLGRNDYVTICRRNADGTACAGSGGWEQGWIIFVDADADGAVDNGEEILYREDVLPANITARGTAGAASAVVYRPNGLTNLTSTQTIMLCDDRGYGDHARGVVITMVGKASNHLATDVGPANCEATSS